MLPTSPNKAGWQGELALGFAPDGARTVLNQREHRGPFLVQRPFYPEGETCHVYLLHPPGGVVGGDSLTGRVVCEAGAHAVVTTPAATKFYRSGGSTAVQRYHLDVASGATLEWLPQEGILFDGARVEMTTRVEVRTDARFVAWDLLCLGRPAAGERFREGSCRQRLEIWRDEVPLLIELTRLEGGHRILDAAWGLGSHTVSGTLVVLPATEENLAAVRTVGGNEETDTFFSATLLREVLVCRYLGSQAEQARHRLGQAWAALRPDLLGKPPCWPRVWET